MIKQIYVCEEKAFRKGKENIFMGKADANSLPIIA